MTKMSSYVQDRLGCPVLPVDDYLTPAHIVLAEVDGAALSHDKKQTFNVRVVVAARCPVVRESAVLKMCAGNREIAKYVASFVSSMSCDVYRERVKKGGGFLTVCVHSKPNDSLSALVRLKLKGGVDVFDSATALFEATQ